MTRGGLTVSSSPAQAPYSVPFQSSAAAGFRSSCLREVSRETTREHDLGRRAPVSGPNASGPVHVRWDEQLVGRVLSSALSGPITQTTGFYSLGSLLQAMHFPTATVIIATPPAPHRPATAAGSSGAPRRRANINSALPLRVVSPLSPQQLQYPHRNARASLYQTHCQFLPEPPSDCRLVAPLSRSSIENTPHKDT